MTIKKNLIGSIAILFVASPSSYADTMASFDDDGDTTFTFERFGLNDGPGIGPGFDGNALRLTERQPGQLNFVTFERSAPGEFPLASFGFDFRITNTETLSADGFSFSFANTENFGTTGGLGNIPFFMAEDPAATGILSFGFDTQQNSDSPHDFIQPGAAFSDYSEISVFYDGNLVSRIDDTRLLPSGFALDDAAVRHASGKVDFEHAKVSLFIDGQPVFDNIAVPGLAPFESRIMIGGRTGGLSQVLEIDNIEVQYGMSAIPEPSSMPVLALLALTVLCGHRSRNFSTPSQTFGKLGKHHFSRD